MTWKKVNASKRNALKLFCNKTQYEFQKFKNGLKKTSFAQVPF